MSEPSEGQTGGGEFEREPVPERARLGLRSFLGMYAGEHVAGTELMIGPLFIASGVSAVDLLSGLLIGNLLAVLSWVLLTAPIATRARLTLYEQLERICGRHLVTLYNLANGVMFCFLAGAMITVAATAIGVRVKFPMPALDDTLPNSAGWVVAVVVVGTLISLVAASGYRAVSKFANIAAPWMILLFVAFGVIGMRELGVTGVGNFWETAKTVIWTGGDPLPGQVKFTFWHVMFFAWFCNMAMHIGMSDLSVLRFARKSWYAVSSGAGMYIGHFVAWLSASILFAVQLRADPENTNVLPGPMAYEACGIAGLICVIVAGWTTANPTIYRAGLAFQAIIPKASRFWITFGTGLLATAAGAFPAIAMQLLGFVALYGLVLMPMGAVIFVDFWVFKRIGLTPAYARATGKRFNWAACAAWLATLVVCVTVSQYPLIAAWLGDRGIELPEWGGIGLFFVSLPGWFLASGLYIVLSKIMQSGGTPATEGATA